MSPFFFDLAFLPFFKKRRHPCSGLVNYRMQFLFANFHFSTIRHFVEITKLFLLFIHIFTFKMYIIYRIHSGWPSSRTITSLRWFRSSTPEASHLWMGCAPTKASWSLGYSFKILVFSERIFSLLNWFSWWCFSFIRIIPRQWDRYSSTRWPILSVSRIGPPKNC